MLRLLDDARRRECLSTEVLAERAGVDRGHLDALGGGTARPTVPVAAALAEALGLSLSDLLLRAERIVQGDDASEGGVELALLPATRPRTVDLACVEADARLRAATGLTGANIAAAIDDTYHTLDLLDRQLTENGLAPFARLVELANLSAMIGNIVGAAIARHSDGRFERSGPHKYQDLRSTTGGEHVEIKVALESNKPKGHLPKAGHYLTFRYVLGDRDGRYRAGARGDVVHIWEVRFGYLEHDDFARSDTARDSGKTAVVRTEVFKAMERVYFAPDYFPMKNLDGPWGRRRTQTALPL
jgi:transcriptional regulator with XRE-family HTH domain